MLRCTTHLKSLLLRDAHLGGVIAGGVHGLWEQAVLLDEILLFHLII